MVLGIGNLGELVVSIGTDLTNLNKGLKDARKKVDDASGEIARALDGVGRTITRIGAITTAGFGATVFAASKFESSFAGVRKTVEATEEEFDRLATNFRNLSKEIPLSVNELNNIAEVVGQLGITGVENITKFTETIGLLGKTTNISGEQAALQLSRFINIIGEGPENVDRLGASIVALGNNFAARENEILDLSLSLASFGQQIGLSSSQVLAFSTIIKASGGEAQAASTAFQKVALTLKDAVITGGDKLEDFARILGKTTDEVVQVFREDASEAIVLFIEGLKRINDEGGSVNQALKSIGLANVRLVREFGKVIGSTEDLRDALKLSADEFEKNTALTIEAEKRFKTFESQLKLFFNRVGDVAIIIGSVLLPALNKLLLSVGSAVTAFGDFVNENRTLARVLIIAGASFGIFALVLGPILVLMGQLVTSVAALTFLMPTLASSTAVLTGVLAIFKTTLIAIPALAAAAFVGWKIGDVIKEVSIFDELLNDEGGLFDRMFDLIDQAILKWGDLTRAITDAIEEEQRLQGTGGAGSLFEGFTPPEGGQVNLNEIEIFREKSDTKEVEDLTKKETILERIRKSFANLRKKAQADEAGTTKRLREDSFNNFKSILAKQAAESKGAAIALQVLGIGEAIINTARGVAQALAIGDITQAILIGVLGAAEVATIAGVKFQEGTDNATIPGLVDPGEIVVPATFANAIREGRLTLGGPGAGGGRSGGGVIFENVEIVVQGNLDEDSVPDILEQIGIQTESSFRGAN